MTSNLSILSKGAVAMCELIDTVCAIDKIHTTPPAENHQDNSLLKKASLVNKLVMLGFSCAEAGAVIKGEKSDVLYKLKGAEILFRTIEVPIKMFDEISRADTSFAGKVRFFEKGVVVPIADLTRVCCEQNYYYERHFLEMPSEEAKDAKRPIYEFDPISESVQIVGFRPVDLDECRTLANSSENAASYAGLVRAGGAAGIATVSAKVGSNLYERISTLLIRNFQRINGDENPPQEVFSLLACEVVPAPLHDDQVLRQYICPITQCPIRYPVGDPNGHTLYEKSAIINWLRAHPRSPVTNQRLTIDQLVQKPAVQALIDSRLRLHQDRLWDYVQQSPLLAEGLAEPSQQEMLELATLEVNGN